MIGWLRRKMKVHPEVVPAASLTDTPPPVVVSEARPPARLSHEKVAARAAEIWHRKGRPYGQDEQNWLEAEIELRAELTSADPRKPR